LSAAANSTEIEEQMCIQSLAQMLFCDNDEISGYRQNWIGIPKSAVAKKRKRPCAGRLAKCGNLA
jgi:hypothetical protein